MTPKIKTPPKPPKLYNSKCNACGDEINYPWHICNGCMQQGVHLSGMEPPKVVKKQ